ncbi:MAG: FkbM family methyltransferase [Bdellovibrionales bacterium]
MIPRILHFIWVGDESRRPDNCIATWRQFHPDWEIKVWGNAELHGREWANSKHIKTMWDERSYDSVADMMRYEILLAEGGVYVDADSVCLRPLSDVFLECDAFAAWENEFALPGLIANNILGFHAGDVLLAKLVESIRAKPDVAGLPPYKVTGPLALTLLVQEMRYDKLTVLPSHFFMPKHHSGQSYTGRGPVFAAHFWAGTRNTSLFDRLHKLDVDGWEKIFPHMNISAVMKKFDGMFNDNDVVTTFTALNEEIKAQGRAVNFVQIGAMDGIFFDSMHPFVQKFGWQGLLVEPMPEHFKALQKNYASQSGLTFERAAITDADGPVDMYYVPTDVIEAEGLDESTRGMSSLLRERNLHNRLDARDILRFQKTETVPGLTLASLFAKHNIGAFDVYVSDTEGMDWVILQQLDLAKHAPRIVFIEFNHLLVPDMVAFVDYMHAHGYRVYLREDTLADALCVRS